MRPITWPFSVFCVVGLLAHSCLCMPQKLHRLGSVNDDITTIESCPIVPGAECQPCPSTVGRFVGCPGTKGLRIEIDCGSNSIRPEGTIIWHNRTWRECHSTKEEDRLNTLRRGIHEVFVFEIVMFVLCCISGGYIVKKRYQRHAEIYSYSRV